MVTRRIAIALVLATWATTAVAEGRSASFGVSVRVVAPLRSRARPASPPSSFVTTPGHSSVPCGAAGSPACLGAVAAAALSTGAPVFVTVFTDGTPSAVLER